MLLVDNRHQGSRLAFEVGDCLVVVAANDPAHRAGIVVLRVVVLVWVWVFPTVATVFAKVFLTVATVADALLFVSCSSKLLLIRSLELGSQLLAICRP
jgi:hypothetical protein